MVDPAVNQPEVVAPPREALAIGPTASVRQRVVRRAMRAALLIGVVVLVAFFAVRSPAFFSVGNFRDIFRLSAAIMVVAVPSAFLLIMGRPDLSVGSVLALGAVVTGLLITRGVPPLAAALVGIAVGAGVGAINGTLVTAVGLSPIIVTLGTLTLIRGVALGLAPNPVFGFGDAFVSFGYDGVFGVPYLVLIAAAIVAVGGFLLAFAPVGRHVLAIGVNDEAAFLSGIDVRRTVLAAYLVTGAAAGLAGVMYAAQLNSAPSGTLGVGFELTVLTAVMLGGVAFDGGRGTISGVVLGVAFLAILQNGLTILNVPAFTASIIQGGALVLAAGLDRASMKAASAIKER